MYRDKFIYGLMAASALFAACSDDFEVAGGPKHPVSEGDEILFGAKNLATFKDGFTDGAEKGGRTVYGDAEYVPGTDGAAGYWKYPLSWIYGDSISIYSPQATYPNDGGKGFANYEVQWEGGAPGDTATNNSLAYLVKMDANGLHWGDLDEPHTFYAFYPKSFIDKDESFGTDPKNTSIVKGEIPKYQPMAKWVKKTEGAKNHWVGLPDMELCLMHATTTVTPNDVAKGTPVQLDFKPLTTAVEVTLIVDDSQSAAADQLQMLHVRGMSKDKSQVQSICGNFSFDLNTGKAVSLDQDITNDYEISVPLWVEETGGPEPLTLNAGDTVTLTVFFLPQEQGTTGLSENPDPANRTMTNLQLEVVNFNGATRVKSYDGVNIPHGTKSQIILPKYSPGTGTLNNWMARIPANTYISQLTIPGATDAFSGEIITNYNYPGDDEDSDFTQTLSVTVQFNKGVRAFEIGTDYNVSNVACGDNSQSSTSVDQYLSNLKGLLDGVTGENGKPTEFIVVTMYFLKGAVGEYDDWVDNLASKLSSWQKNYGVTAFRSNMTVGDARGKILLMARTNGTENNFGKLSGIPVIHGWNNMKDKWMQRGYDITNTNYFLTGDRINQWNGTTDPRDVKTEPTLENWKYDDPNNGTPYYVQEWKRVCREEDDYDYWGVGMGLSKTCHWYESFTEKVGNVVDFFGMTKSVLKNATDGKNIFINSLGGYYIVSNGYVLFDSYSSSAAPNSAAVSTYGRTGNIAWYSNDINTAIYKYMQNVSYAERGPVGIVYFNFVGVEGYGKFEMHGDYLLKTLIGNNFSFPLLGTSGN